MIKLSVIIPKKGKYKSKIKGYSVSEGRAFVYLPKHPNAKPNGYVALARVIMEYKLGRYLKNGEVVHHKNKNTLDDRLKNLELLSVVEHSKIHYNPKKMTEARRRKYPDNWNPNIMGNKNPNWGEEKFL